MRDPVWRGPAWHPASRGVLGLGMADFVVIGDIANVEVIARGRAIRELARLNRVYGRANWRKMKGEAIIMFQSGHVRRAELHWYEGHGVGRCELKRKGYLD